MEFHRKVLSNGLTVRHEKRDVDVTTVMFAVKYGSIYESEKDKGVAHFIEHLCFKGTEKRNAKEIAATLEGVGGNLNAFTSEEITAYHVKLPSNHLELAVDVLSDIFFNPIFPEEEIKRESNVILEEIKMYHDNPRAHIFEAIKSNLYENPFGQFIAGTEKNVKSMGREFLLNRHRSVYVPQNSILSIVGNNDFDEVLKLVEKYVKVKRELKKPKIPVIKKRMLSNAEKRKDILQTNLALGIHMNKMSDKERYAIELFNEILGSGMSSKLFTEVRERRGLVYNVGSNVDLGNNYGYMVISAGTEKSKVDEVIKVCKEEFSKVANVDEKELKKAKIQIIGKNKVENEDSNDTALKLILNEFAGDVKGHYNYSKRINEVKLEDLKKIAKKKDFASFVLSN